MERMRIFFITAFSMAYISNALNAQQTMNTNQSLDTKQQSIVTISAFTAKGDLGKLENALKEGLNAGLTINEIKEVLVQLYAYAGFPRSLNALNTFMTVLKDRKAKGIDDKPGKEASKLPTNKTSLQFGTAMQTKLVGQPVKGKIYEFAPAIDQFLKEHLFGDIFGRDNLDWKTRELATISALAGLGGVENQLRSHFGVGMYNGLTEEQLKNTVSIIQSSVGSKEGIAASHLLQAVLQRQNNNATGIPATTKELETNNDQSVNTIYPKGDKITNNNFTGNAWLHQMVMADSLNPNMVGSVTFEPGARSNWHYHPSGQILLIISGTAWYQEKGSAKRILKKGETVKCPPDTPHWHGASKDDHLIQVAITNSKNGGTVWLEPVSDKEYNN
jgi:4-carboxymuconolactone decarboxylase